jgi:formate hydrogenlyase transcriptional activator
MIAAGANLSDIVENLCDGIDALHPDIISTILLMDAGGKRLWPAAGRRVPQGWKKAITPLDIGARMGSCGTAAFRKETVICSDIASDQLWSGTPAAKYREIALSHGIRAAWSQPLISKENEVLGTFAMYYSEPRVPDDDDLRLIAEAGQIALIAIETERSQVALKKALVEIKKSENRLRTIVDTIPALAWSARPDGSAEFFNRRWLDYAGLTSEESAEWGWTVALHPQDRDRLMHYWQTLLLSGDAGEIEGRLRRFDGEYRWFLFRASPLRDDSGVVVKWYGTNTDIDERKRAEERLKRSEADLHEAQRLSHTGSWKHDAASATVTFSPEMYRIWGISSGDDTSRPEFWWNRIHPEDLKHTREIFENSLREKTNYEADYRIIHSDGAIRHQHAVGHPILNESGELVEFIGTVIDTTEQIEARSALERAYERIEKSEAQLQQIVDAIPQVIAVLKPDGTLVYANQPMLDYTGSSSEQVTAADFRERVFHPEDIARLQIERLEALSRGEPFANEQRILRHDGQYRWFLIQYKPFRDELGRVIRWYATGTDIDDRKQAEERMRSENLALQEQIDRDRMFQDIVGSSNALRKVLSHVAKVAPSDSTVLILGETGTGKECIARAIHKRSKRAERAFIAVNCAAIPPSLIASELFGHEKGSFTGATHKRLGRFEAANGGTIFLDEVGDLPPEIQIALLRVLQQREIERVGSDRPIPVDVRVLAATHRDLNALVAEGSFRQDLLYRLNVIPIEIPSLRERAEDISLLVEYFIDRYGKKVGKTFRTIDKRTLKLFQEYSWPGNIRELQNVIERAVILSDNDVFSVDETWLKREPARVAGPNVALNGALFQQEKEMIEAALAESYGRVSGPDGAAARLGIPARTLDSKIKRLGINKHRFKA